MAAPDIPARLAEAMRYSLFAGGKRVRPVLAIAGFEACGGTGDTVLPLCAALEMIHTYSLIHDDLPAMDNDDFRRGKPTNHKVFGEAVAILAGDALLTQAFEILSDEREMAQIDPARIAAVIAEVARGAGSSGMVGGQTIDIMSEGMTIEAALLEELHSRKTGALIRASVVSGAILAGGSPERIAALRSYGSNIGLAFQIADDILDVTATAEELGKSTSDEARGKKTWPSMHGLDTARAMAARLSADAVAVLEPFGNAAWPLRAIAEYIVARKN
jgi:geranylgeranyl diphosphate synthase type II